MSVTAKFKVSRISDMGWGTEIEMVPDYANGRNKEWATSTPAGMIRMTIKNDLAAEVFKKDIDENGSQTGKAFTILFEPEEV
jgi:hypothetical protein